MLASFKKKKNTFLEFPESNKRLGADKKNLVGRTQKKKKMADTQHQKQWDT